MNVALTCAGPRNQSKSHCWSWRERLQNFGGCLSVAARRSLMPYMGTTITSTYAYPHRSLLFGVTKLHICPVVYDAASACTTRHTGRAPAEYEILRQLLE